MKWIKCSDQLPEEKVYVLVYTEKIGSSDSAEKVAYCYFYEDETPYWTCCAKVTHWMPLPNPPEDNK